MRMRSLLALTVLASTTFASAIAQAHFLDIPNANFMAGGSIGYAGQKENFGTRFHTVLPLAPAGLLNPIPPPISEHKNERIGDRGMFLGLMAGWQYRCHRWMLGLEGDVNFQDFERVHRFAFNDGVLGYNGSALYDRGNIYGLTGRIGYFVTPGFMPYIRIGGQVSRDEVQYQASIPYLMSVIDSNSPTFVSRTVYDASSHKKDIYGGVAALGVEFPTFIGASTIRFEYVFSRTDRLAIDDTQAPIIGTHKFRYPETQAGKISWIWNFI